MGQSAVSSFARPPGQGELERAAPVISEKDMVALHDQAVSANGTVQQVLDWFRAQDVDPSGAIQFGKLMGEVGERSVKDGTFGIADAVGGAALGGIELGIRIERLRREREGK